MCGFFASGRAEGFKGRYHGVLEVLLFGAALYNAVAWLWRREAHLAVNAGFYAVLTVVEDGKRRHHRDARKAA